jgi:hypothetical protein
VCVEGERRDFHSSSGAAAQPARRSPTDGAIVQKKKKKKFSPVSGVNTAHILEMIGLMLEQSGGVRSRKRRRSQNNVPLAISSGFLF